MPKFIDHHKAVQMPPEAAQKAVADMKAGRANQFGVKPINGFFAKNEMWCYCEAPNADAVHKMHEAYGLKLGPGEVTEVTSMV